jgi:hypothetical protein
MQRELVFVFFGSFHKFCMSVKTFEDGQGKAAAAISRLLRKMSSTGMWIKRQRTWIINDAEKECFKDGNHPTIVLPVPCQ